MNGEQLFGKSGPKYHFLFRKIHKAIIFTFTVI